MKKKQKKPSAESLLREEVDFLKIKLANTSNDLSRKTEILSKIETIVLPSPSYSLVKRSEEVTEVVMELMLFRRQHKDSIHQEVFEIKRLEKIIMWLVNPNATDQSKKIEELEERFGISKKY